MPATECLPRAPSGISKAADDCKLERSPSGKMKEVQHMAELESEALPAATVQLNSKMCKGEVRPEKTKQRE